jgi:predicted GH43/DUF377 family glycosyl hydrolase
MYYAARRDSSKPLQIGVATSPDGINWTRYPDSVIAPGPVGRWDDNCVYGPDVVFHHGEYLMFYVGQRIGGGCGIGLATSVDGFHWQKPLTTPVIANGACLSTHVDGDSVIMLYMANNGFRRASSFNGINWTIHPSSVVFPPGDTTQWDEIIASPSLVILDGQYHLWYTGADTLGNARGKIQIGWATSTNRGVTWTRFAGNPAIVPTQPWEGKCLYSNNAVMSSTKYEMWYASAGFGYAYNDVTSNRKAMSNEQRAMSLRVVQNPTTTRQGIRLLTTCHSPHAKLQIYDVAGKLVRSVALSSMPYAHSSSPSAPCPIALHLRPGVYFIRLKAEGATTTRKVVVLE